MLDAEIWKRLLWKEARESGLIMVIPLASLLVAYWSHDYILWILPSFVVPLTITMWATMKAQQKSTKHSEWFKLPMNPRTDWTASFAIPLIIAGIVGVLFGYLVSSSMLPTFDLPAEKMAHAIRSSTLIGALCMMAGFAICYMTAITFSLPLAILFSVAWVVPAIFVPNSISDPFRDSNYPFITFLVRGVTGAGAASVIFPVLSRRKSYKAAKAWAAILIIVIPLAPLTKVLYNNMMNKPDYYYDYLEHMKMYSPDSKLSIISLPESTETTKILLVTDHEHNSTRQKPFDADISVMNISNDGTVYIAQQLPTDSDIKIIRWDTDTNQVSSVMTFPAGKETLWKPIHKSLSPDGRYLTIVTPSQVGTGSDLWVLDLERKEGRIIVPNQFFSDSIIYSGDQIFISCIGGGLVVDLHNMTVSRLNLPPLPRR